MWSSRRIRSRNTLSLSRRKASRFVIPGDRQNRIRAHSVDPAHKTDVQRILVALNAEQIGDHCTTPGCLEGES